MNKNDSEIMAGLLEYKLGYLETDDPHAANLVIFNTCAVRGNAENRAMSRVQEFDALRKKHQRDQVLVLAGCVPQYEEKAILKKYPYLDCIIGTNTIDKLIEFLEGKAGSERSFIEKNKDIKNISNNMHRKSKVQAWISIMYGCNNFCSYCVVPFTRGKETSRTKEEIIKEIESLRGSEYKEVVLLGQNVNSYGNHLYGNYDFSDLLHDVHEIDFIEKIDFLTSHPKDMSIKLIDTIKKLPKIGREIHFPLQAGDNLILRAMNRGYDYKQYFDLVKVLRFRVKDVQISTDLIVGFPGETEEQFQNTIKAVKEIGFYRVTTAAYSPRNGTSAALMENQISEEVKHERLLRLQDVVRKFAVRN